MQHICSNPLQRRPCAQKGNLLNVKVISVYISGCCATVWFDPCSGCGRHGFNFLHMRAGPCEAEGVFKLGEGFPPHARRASTSLPFSPSGMMPYAASGGRGAVVAVCPRGHPLGYTGYFSIYFWSLRHNVVRSMPSFRAAWVRFPPHARRASNSLSFSPSGMVPYAASGGKGLLLPRAPEGTRLDV